MSVSGKVEGRRIDSYLAARFCQYSRSFFQKLISEGRVSLKGRKVKNSSVLQRGDEIGEGLPAIDKKILPQDLPIDVLFEDEFSITVNKDAASVVHPAPSQPNGTRINAVFGRFRDRVENEDGFYPKVCHRIDKDTTGVILIGLTETEHAAITRQFEDRTVTKKYWAIVEGVVKPEEGEIDLPIFFEPMVSKVSVIDHEKGKHALTLFTVRERFDSHTLLELELKTGRTHQIRIHLASIGHPIICDGDYGCGEPMFPQDLAGHQHDSLEPVIERQALHSKMLEFAHPLTDERVRIEAPLKADMKSVIELLSQGDKTL